MKKNLVALETLENGARFETSASRRRGVVNGRHTTKGVTVQFDDASDPVTLHGGVLVRPLGEDSLDVERGYGALLLTHTDPWTVEIEAAAFNRPDTGPSVADVLSQLGWRVRVHD